VTITFNAAEGNKGLQGHSGEVYAHTGVLTSESQTPSDWQYVKTDWGENTPETKLTQIGSNTYRLTITPSIREYYGVPADEVIEQIALVFRSGEPVGGGYREGKTESNGDIFVEVYEEDPGLILTIANPEMNDVLIQPSGQLNIRANTSVAATITITEEGNTLTSVEDATSINYNYTAPGDGDGILTVTATNGAASVSEDITYTVTAANPPIAELPPGAQLGAEDISDTRVRFVLEAPNKDFVYLKGSFNDFRYNGDFLMNQTPDGKFHWIEVDGFTDGDDILYQYAVDDEIFVADPYSELILDPFNDRFISERKFPNLPEHPERVSSEIISYFKKGGFTYNWEVDNFQPAVNTDLVFYELLVRL
jgi:hypothetical protein